MLQRCPALHARYARKRHSTCSSQLHSNFKPQRISKRALVVASFNKNGKTSSTGPTDLRFWWQQQSTQAVQYIDKQFGLALYRYFRDWRKDAFSDLQAILLLALAANVMLAAVKVLVLGESGIQAWEDFYESAVVTFGEAWPAETAPVMQQVSSIGLYLSGLIGFAVLLALVEQSVLQVYETRVELGSPVLETGHILVLCWCKSPADVSKLETILRQLCAAYKCSGGRTIVILCQRRKTEMEDLLRNAIPQQQRGGSRFVFRQGNPLTAADLKLVAADDASAVLVLADTAATADASDSQVLRVLVLLDESEVAARQEGRPRPSPGHVVAEVLTNDAMPLLKFVPSKAVLPLPSHRLNATRLAVLVTRPVVSHLTDTLWDFENSSAVFMHHFPQLAGQTVADVALRFENGIVIGLLEASTGFVLINPPPAYKLNADERIILLRPTQMKECDVQPLPLPVPARVGSYSAEAAAAAWRQSQQSLNMPMVISCGCSDVPETSDQAVGQPPTPLDNIASNSCDDPVGAMQEQLLQHQQLQQQQWDPLQGQQQAAVANSDASLNAADASKNGSQLLLGAESRPAAAAGAATNGAAAVNGHSAATAATTGGQNGSVPADGGCSVASWDLERGGSMPSYEVMDLLKGTRPGFSTCRMFSLAESSVQLSRFTPLNLLVLGWGDSEFMSQLLLALGTGSSALPAGSRVVFANAHSVESTLQPALAAAGPPELLVGLAVEHVQLDPLSRSQLGKLDLETANAAIVLCDACWRHQNTLNPWSIASNGAAAATTAHATVYSSAHKSLAASSSGGGSLDTAPGAGSGGLSYLSEGFGLSSGGGGGGGSVFAVGAGGSGMDADVLQLDALLLRVQLNLRSILENIGREQEVNIITEKVGTEQDTRFEDKARLPLGVPVNLSSYTACMASQLAVCPLMVLPGRGGARTLGAQIDPLIVDADLYTDVGDRVSFWQLMRRAQLLGHVLLGYYVLPVAAADPIEAVLCPPGPSRYEKRIWNTGDNRLKFIVLQDAESASSQQQQQQQMREEAVAASIASSAASRAAAAAKAAAEELATYYPVDGGWQWWMR